MGVNQFVMAYRADHEKIRALLPGDFESLRPVLRINVEIISDGPAESRVRIEFNTPVAARGKRGWLNLKTWETPGTKITYQILDQHVGEKTPGSETAVKGHTTAFQTDFLEIEYTGVGLAGGCPAENDNDGCFYSDGGEYVFVASEPINACKEYCDCRFTWTDPFMEAMKIEREEILGAYKVTFNR
ncbi:hypothetical protein [Bacilliculturomica massiliensis]|uniref:hypothetical protein n=1 Tax=Bacilliculturomica massiliensis TaxID=1917867 RepID=UPI00102FCAEE|nr:hypothetical protein [Bacilliculturomica massiliensis]